MTEREARSQNETRENLATISRADFATKRKHQYAGYRDDESYALHGLPLYDAWWLEYDKRHGTMLVFGRVEA